MSQTKTCGRCAAEMLEDTAGGLCPRCLMALNFETRTMPEEEAPQMAVPLSQEELRELFPQFEVLECLGRGGMGVVYKARQKTLDRIVAIKVLAGEWHGDPGFAKRFEKEAKTLAQMNHPNIVTVHDFGETDGLYYIVMEYVDGVNLRDVLQEGTLPPEQALTIVPPICEALQYAHDKGIVHRDIKPENLLLDRQGRIKIADFGIAALLGTDGDSAGTPPYMAPEQTDASAEVDNRADIYALGVVLYEMLTGERPNKELVAPSKKVQIDVRLDEIVLRALEKTPALRYQTAGEFRTVVETMVGRLPDAGEAATHPAPKTAEVSARGTWLPYAGLIALLAGVWWTYLWWGDPVEGRSMRPTGVIVAVIGLFVMLKGLLQAVGARRVDSAVQKADSPHRLGDLAHQPSRFSRTAIVGAMWAALVFIAFCLMFMVQLVSTGEDYRDHGWTLWRGVAKTVFVGLGFTAPFGTTILGWIAVNQIRRSAGKLHGLWLAVFDGVLFPLLAMIGLIGWFWHWVFVDLIRTPIMEEGDSLTTFERMLVSNATALTVLATLGASLIVCVFIIRAVWRAVNRPLTGDSPAAAPAAPRPVNRTALSVGFGIMMLSIFGTQTLLNHLKGDQASPSEARAKIEQTLKQEITKQLTAHSDRFKMITVILDPELKTGVVELDGLQEMRGIDGKNVWVDIESSDGPDGSMKLKNNGGDWLVEGEGPLGAVIFTVPLRDLTRTAQGNSTATAQNRSRTPRSATFNRNAGMVLVHHDNVDLHYALFAPKALGTWVSDQYDPRSFAWRDHGTFSLTDQHVFGYDRESTNPFLLQINGKEYDLRRGRVLVPHYDGTVEQLKLFPSLATANSPEELTKLTDYARTMSGEPVTVEKLRRQLEAAEAQLKDAMKTCAPTHPFVAEVRESIAMLKKKIAEQGSGAAPSPTFGPVMERTLNDPNENLKDSLISLDSGTLRTLPDHLLTRLQSEKPEEDQLDTAVMDQWLRVPNQRFDALARLTLQDGKVTQFGLRTFQLLAVPIEPEQADAITAENARAKIDQRLHETAFIGRINDLMTERGKRIAYIFKTVQGQIGILQITDFTENPRGVKIRYKLVLDGPEPSAKAMPTFESVSDAARRLITKYFPEAVIMAKGDEFKATHATREYEIHGQPKVGELAQETHKQTGPSADGFILRIRRMDDPFIPQQELFSGRLRSFSKPYWKGYSNETFDPSTKHGVGITYEFGASLNQEFHQAMLELLKLAGNSATKPVAVGMSAPRIGKLGSRLGTYLTIGGVRAEEGKVGIHTLLVDTIGENKLDQPIGIWIENVELPKGERCVLKGYETGRMIGTPDEVLRATGAPQPQAKWQFSFYFIATSVEQPENLKLTSDGPPTETGFNVNQLQDVQQRWAQALKDQEQALKEMAELTAKTDLSGSEREAQERPIKIKLHDLESEIIRIRALIQQLSPPPSTPVAREIAEASELKGQKYMETFRAPLELVEAAEFADGGSLGFAFKDSQSHKLEFVLNRAEVAAVPKGTYDRLYVGSMYKDDASLAASGGKTEKLVLSLLRQWVKEYVPEKTANELRSRRPGLGLSETELKKMHVIDAMDTLAKRNGDSPPPLSPPGQGSSAIPSPAPAGREAELENRLSKTTEELNAAMNAQAELAKDLAVEKAAADAKRKLEEDLAEKRSVQLIEAIRGPLELMEANRYKDGGTLGFVFKDSQSHTLEFFLDRQEVTDPPNRFYNRLFVGAKAPGNPDALLAAIGGKAEKLLIPLINQWWLDHINLSRIDEPTTRVKEALLLLEKRNSTARLQFRLMADDKDAEAEPVTRRYTQGRPNVSREVLLDETCVSSAKVVENGPGRAVLVKFNDAGAKKFVTLIFAHDGRKLAIVFDHGLIAEPTIHAGMNDFSTDPQMLITGNFNNDEAARLAATLTTAIQTAAERSKPEPER